MDTAFGTDTLCLEQELERYNTQRILITRSKEGQCSHHPCDYCIGLRMFPFTLSYAIKTSLQGPNLAEWLSVPAATPLHLPQWKEHYFPRLFALCAHTRSAKTQSGRLPTGSHPLPRQLSARTVLWKALRESAS